MLNIVLLAGILITVCTVIPVLLQMRNHPKGLFICFFAEMWERFSYYGMRGLLIYYLTQHFLFTDGHASEQYASYTTLVYLLPLIGGLVADRWIGTRRAIIFGGLLLVAGHMGMALEGTPNKQTLTYQGATYEFVKGEIKDGGKVQLKVGDALYDYGPTDNGGLEVKGLPGDAPLPAVLPKGGYELGVVKVTPWAEHAFYLSISLIIMGVGFLKPNISTIVGQLYPQKDPRRDSGFQLYYFGINLGSFWAAIGCGLLGQTVGWWAGFGLAGLGMLAGLLCFVLGRKWLEGKGEAPNPAVLTEKAIGGISKEHLIYILGLLGVPLVYFLVQKNQIVGIALTVGSLIMLGYVVYNMVTKFTKEENFRVGLALLLSLASVVFFTLFEQAGSSLSLFAERNTNLNIIADPILFEAFGRTIVLASSEQLAALSVPANHVWVDMGLTPSQTQTFNAGFILIFAPIFAALFTYLGRRKIDPDPVKKFAFGLVNVGLGFLILVWAAGLADSSFKLPLLFLLLTYLFHTWGELALSPVGLSQQTKLSPPLIVATMMALWFTGSSWAQYLGGFISKMAATETVGGQVLDAKAALATSLETFNLIGWWGIGLGAGLFVISFFVAKWSYGANDSE
ncbi:MFS transporter [Asticcacaulis sp. BYS171W]|uniref:MFS transporter n=1 Tax=Asticcacaulis aquaticus TaxID=2984212 RepID=A0ABT5HZD4_9CAUL|nr:MFS transporter [Asticcacaulis aquaticus]MDC7685205.1 MFS transporter [Asticcacaulis aquaticus]